MKRLLAVALVLVLGAPPAAYALDPLVLTSPCARTTAEYLFLVYGDPTDPGIDVQIDGGRWSELIPFKYAPPWELDVPHSTGTSLTVRYTDHPEVTSEPVVGTAAKCGDPTPAPTPNPTPAPTPDPTVTPAVTPAPPTHTVAAPPVPGRTAVPAPVVHVAAPGGVCS